MAVIAAAAAAAAAAEDGDHDQRMQERVRPNLVAEVSLQESTLKRESYLS
jgi:hypothetical protein